MPARFHKLRWPLLAATTLVIVASTGAAATQASTGPTITSVSPTSGFVSTPVTLTLSSPASCGGAHGSLDLRVEFSSDVTSTGLFPCTQIDSTHVRATVPRGAMTGTIYLFPAGATTGNPGPTFYVFHPPLWAKSSSLSAGIFPIYGLLSSTGPGSGSAAVRGENQGTNGNGYGVYGSDAGSGIGVFGVSHSGDGVRGNTTVLGAAGVLGYNSAGGPGLSAVVASNSVAPLSVNSTHVVPNLHSANSDELGGHTAASFQTRVSGACAAGSAIGTVNANGTVSCQSILGSGWSLTGNAGTTAGTDFLGTTDNQPFELKVDGERALRLEPDANGPNVIAGYSGNSVTEGSSGATVGGGGGPAAVNTVKGSYGTVSGGTSNTAAAEYSTVGGGNDNAANGLSSLISGGIFNTAVGDNSVVGGGTGNTAASDGTAIAGGGSNAAGDPNDPTNAEFATVGGGSANTASGGYATIPGGTGNSAAGEGSFAAGMNADAALDGSFVWGDDSTSDPVAALAANTFDIRAAGGIWLGTTSAPTDPMGNGRFIDTSTGAYLSSDGTWTNNSDAAKKQDFRKLNPLRVLEQIGNMSIANWSYKVDKPSIRHVGPTAQDFYKAFGLGLDDKHISTIDEGGVALAAIKGLYQQNRRLEQQNHSLDARLTELERAVRKLQRR
jgi:trimeric autotransporter adhesin